MEFEEFCEKINLAVVPEKEEYYPKGHRFEGLLEPTTFWVHTMNMGEIFGKPEMEFHGVPMQFLPMAHAELNSWAYYCATSTNPVLPDQHMGGQGTPIIWKVIDVSTDPYWVDQKRNAYRLEVLGMPFKCKKCALGIPH